MPLQLCGRLYLRSLCNTYRLIYLLRCTSFLLVAARAVQHGRHCRAASVGAPVPVEMHRTICNQSTRNCQSPQRSGAWARGETTDRDTAVPQTAPHTLESARAAVIPWHGRNCLLVPQAVSGPRRRPRCEHHRIIRSAVLHDHIFANSVSHLAFHSCPVPRRLQR